ncbi:MAG: hypothetical protein M1832_004043 [Thelocarpon impressellum]|nr:MAG: hypothetical protein M1832_004043 [Thelocarpon impressellum]
MAQGEPSFSRLECLPDELLNEILECLPKQDQCRASAASRRLYGPASTHVFRSVWLVDRRAKDDGDGPPEGSHHVTDMIKILETLIANPSLASKVQTLTLSCHQDPGHPVGRQLDSATGLPLDGDQGLAFRLLPQAIRVMGNVRTLRLINGHHALTRITLRGFFDGRRQCNTPVRRLWIETCELADVPLFKEDPLSGGLESIRLRRLAFEPDSVHAESKHEIPPASEPIEEEVNVRDGERHGPEKPRPRTLVLNMLSASSETLTSINLDWLKGLTDEFDEFWSRLPTFRHLRALQLRSALMDEGDTSGQCCLFDPSTAAFRFIQRHSRIQCLAWPIEGFFPQWSSAAEESVEVRSVIGDLAKTLKALRVDSKIQMSGEPVTDMKTSPSAVSRRRRRRRFIKHFAAEMRVLELLKIEGGIPQDETRELVRAVRCCPLKKLVIIGISWPLGKVIPPLRVPGAPAVPAQAAAYSSISALPAVGSWQAAETARPSEPSKDFLPIYGARDLTIIDVIASQFPHSMRELKFTGFGDSADVHDARHVHLTDQTLRPLRHLSKLRSLTLSLSLDTRFEDERQDQAVASFWTHSQTPSSTALALHAASEAEPPSSWAVLLQTKFTPEAVAARVVSLVGPNLARSPPPSPPLDSPLPNQHRPAAGRVVDVRALFMLEVDGLYEIYDLNMGIAGGSGGRDGALAYLRGPRGEADESRLRDKLEARAWF